MSYCVNCGVELDDSAKKCALCGTQVINPNKTDNDKVSPPPFSDIIVIPSETRRRYAAFITSMVILIPNIVCSLINFLFDFDYQWATYLNATSALVWLVLVFPFLMKKPRSYIIVPFDAMGAFFFAFVYYRMENGNGWLLRLALPIIIIFSLFCISVAELIRRKKIDWPLIVSTILIETSLLSFVTEFVIRRYYGSVPFPLVSIIITACCVALGFFFLSVFKNKRLRAWLSRKFFI